MVYPLNFKKLYFFIPLLLIACSQQESSKTIVGKAGTSESTVSSDERKEIKTAPIDPKIHKYCQKIQKSFKRYSWGNSRCIEHKWKFVRDSVLGDPLVWKVYGVEKNVKQKESTIILCGVHGDEITPVKFCFDVIDHLDDIAAGKHVGPDPNKSYSFEDRLVIVAPLVNPDSFFKARPTRTNANGVDVNRNLPTKDFAKNALKRWTRHYGSDKRRYPGKHAMSEPETVFQVNLIKRYRPDKIISVHAPLTMLDYDGPTSRIQGGGGLGTRANQLLIQMSEEARGYRIKNYPFFTGSLGNYAGNERGIPTYTLELPTANPRDHKKHWNRFRNAINSAVFQDMEAGEKNVDMAYKKN